MGPFSRLFFFSALALFALSFLKPVQAISCAELFSQGSKSFSPPAVIPEAIFKLYPDLYPKLTKIQTLLPSTAEAFVQAHPGRSVSDLIQTIIQIRNKQANELQAISVAFNENTAIFDAYSKTIRTVRVTDSETAKFKRHADSFAGESLAPPPWTRTQGSQIDRQLNVISGMIASSVGAIAELQVAHRVRGLSGFNVKIKDLYPDYAKLVQNSRLSPGQLRYLGELVINVVFNQGLSLGDIKFLNRIASSHRDIQKILERAPLLTLLSRRLASTSRGAPDFHYFFLNGIDPKIARALSDIGGRVHSQ